MGATLAKLFQGMDIQTLGNTTRIREAVELISILGKVTPLDYIIVPKFAIYKISFLSLISFLSFP